MLFMQRIFLFIFFSLNGCFFACSDLSKKPLDAASRRAVDSLATLGIQQTRLQIDSIYKDARVSRMPQVLDSIRQQRLREIEEQLRSIPR
jgi:hypothetical protein